MAPRLPQAPLRGMFLTLYFIEPRLILALFRNLPSPPNPSNIHFSSARNATPDGKQKSSRSTRLPSVMQPPPMVEQPLCDPELEQKTQSIETEVGIGGASLL